jgi:hypothetical protein
MNPVLARPTREDRPLMGSRPTHDPADFNGLARAYRWMEWASFGPFLSLCRSTFLRRLTSCRNALVLGDGDGRFTARLMRSSPHIRVHAVDASPAMLASLTHACGPNATRLKTQHEDINAWQPQPTAEYDLVITHFFLDCFSTPEVLALAQRIRPIISPDALWVVSEFAVPPGWFGRLVAAPIVRGLYFAFGLFTGLQVRTLPDYASALSAAGFIRIAHRPRLGGLLVSELWTLSSRGSAPLPGQSSPIATRY